ncbi:MAG: hypothetical protein A2293_02610 [Elusimicrobia bacterium RIFOXYB2_FULL_49_7]|nr:MAG: hypothetical protein A2293_02610 [Elusimicrobia bacterium RIFOXYB2_FULL_49_7]
MKSPKEKSIFEAIIMASKYGSIYLLLAGRFRPTKGFHRVIQLLPNWLKKAPPLKLIIAGSFKPGVSPLFKSDFMKDIKESPARSRIELHLLHSEDKSGLERFYRKADILLLPYEAGSTRDILAEGMAHGLPWIASDLPGFVEERKRSGNGYIVHDDTELTEAVLTLSRQGNRFSKKI